ncbi:MAG: nicotinate-nucleotide adenylyltransferase [Desulfobacterales bacterium]
MKHIGLFGGTFNPIHLGHIQVIQEVKKGFGLDKIFIIPSALPPHKEPDGLVDAGDRVEMIRLSFSNHPDFAVSDVELKRSGPSYTIDTVRNFKSILPEDTELFLILGLDAFLEIATWKSYKDLFLLIPFIVMSRGTEGEDGTVFGRKTVEDYLKSKISEGYKLSASQSSYVHEEKKPVFVFNVTPIDISSTKIRKLIKNGSTIKTLVPEIVEAFIKSKGLYL